MNESMICRSTGSYSDALTRGKIYQVLQRDDLKRQVRLRGDNGRIRWYMSHLFGPEDSIIPLLVSWQFDNDIEDPTCDCVEVTVHFSDETRGWCSIGTPEYFKRRLDARSDPKDWKVSTEPAVWGSNLILVRRLDFVTVDWTLRYMDQQGELTSFSLPYEI